MWHVACCALGRPNVTCAEARLSYVSQQARHSKLVVKEYPFQRSLQPSLFATCGALHVGHLAEPASFLFFVDSSIWNVLSLKPWAQIPDHFHDWLSPLEIFKTRSSINRLRRRRDPPRGGTWAGALLLSMRRFCRGNFTLGGGNQSHRHHQWSSHCGRTNLYQHLHQHHLISNPSSSLVFNCWPKPEISICGLLVVLITSCSWC